MKKVRISIVSTSTKLLFLAQEMELTNHNVSSLGGSNIAVHFLRSKDNYVYGMCFKKSGTEAIEVLWYTTKDTRGPVSMFIPSNEYLKRTMAPDVVNSTWDTKGTILKAKFLDHSLWAESTYVFKITSEEYRAYQEWLIIWIAAATQYSLFEGGRTSRIFMAASLKYFESITSALSLLTQEVTTLEIEFTSKETLSVIELHDAMKWFNDLHNSINMYDNSIKSTILYINTSHTMYYREQLDGISKMWKLSGVNIRNVTKSLSSSESYPPLVRQYVDEVQLIKLEDITINTCPPVLAPVLPPPALPLESSSKSSVVIIFLVVLIIIIILIVVFVWYLDDKKTATPLAMSSQIIPTTTVSC